MSVSSGYRARWCSSSTPAYSLTVVATVGTTITPYMQVYVQSSVAEKNLTMATHKYQRVDIDVGIHILGV
jgi:Mn2+/Fe2+ NRAMP family transporter